MHPFDGLHSHDFHCNLKNLTGNGTRASIVRQRVANWALANGMKTTHFTIISGNGEENWK
jgi:hypothetical protein